MWKANSLSLAGRVTLVQSVLSSIPIYSMQTALLPRGICDEVEKLSMRFIWVGTIMLAKRLWWFGFEKNEEHEMKLGWGVMTRKNDIWVKIIRGKYRCGEDMIPNIQRRKNDFNTWQEIYMYCLEICEGRMFLANRRWEWCFFFWKDKWINMEKPWLEYVIREDSEEEENLRVYKQVDDNGKWNVLKLETVMPEEICKKVMAQLCLNADIGEDIIKWNNSSDGCFKTREAYI